MSAALVLARQAARMLAREWRSGELRVLAIALAVAVASVSGVGLFTERMERGMERGATELLGADLLLYSHRAIDAALAEAARERGLSAAATVSFRSVVVAGDAMQLAEVKAVSDGYPLRGQALLAARAFGAAEPAAGIPSAGSVWTDARLLALLGRAVGDELEVGRSRLKVEAVLAYEPDRGGDMFSIAPRLMMNMADLEATGLVVPGSRVSHRLLLAGDETAVAQFRRWLERTAGPDQRIQGVRDARPELRAALERGGRFLALAALVAVLLCGVAIAMAARQYAERHLDAAALLRCLGASQARVISLHLLKLGLLAAAACALGAALGWLAQELLAQLMDRLLLTRLPPPSPLALGQGVAIGLVALIGFSLPPMLALREVPPARVLRRELGAVALRRGVVAALAAFTIAALVLWQARDVELALLVMGGAALSIAALLAVSRLALAALAGVRATVGVSWRFGVANLVRRAGASTLQVAAFGLGLSMLLLLGIVRDDLLEQWQSSLPPEAPNFFLVNVREQDVDGLSALLAARTGSDAALYPMIRGRLVERNGAPILADNFEDPRARNRLTRGFNLSHARRLRADNRVVEGRIWRADEAAPGEVSIERGVAEVLGLDVGDRLTFDVAGRRFDARLTSVREVDWDSFRVNFFVIASPGTLDGFPATYITSFHLPPQQRDLLVSLVRSFPTVTVIDVDALMAKVREIMDRASRGIEVVFAFTLLAGLTVLFAAVHATLDERRYETAILRTLGARRSGIVKGLLAEFALLGAVAGALASLAAWGLGAVVADRILSVSYAPGLALWLIGPALGAGGVAVAGLIGTWPVLGHPPMATLRAQ